MVKRFMLTPCWAGGINSGTVLTPPQTGATRWCESKAYMSSAVTEPLEPLLRALFGHSRRTLPMIAVTEPLEPTLRAQFGQSRRTLPMIAVTEPLEPPLRPQFGHSRRSLPMIAVIEPLEPPRALRRSCKVRENVSKEEYTLSVTTFEGRGSPAAIRKETARLSRLFILLIWTSRPSNRSE